jgi:hypothetical protein
MRIAQVEEVRRKRARIVYPCKNGRLRFPLVAIETLQRLIEQEPLMPGLHNPFKRAGATRKGKRHEPR